MLVNGVKQRVSIIINFIHKHHLSSSQLRKMSGSVDYVVTGQNDTLLKEMVRHLAPPLNHEMHKGQAGRIGIVGGSTEYTGAPYYAAITALRVGCDLAHVFCMSGASAVIKSYSPELIVHPLLDHPNCNQEIPNWMQRLHAMVVGPGLGREEKTMNATTDILENVKAMNIPVVIDGDGLFLVKENPDVIRDYRKAILTPNAVEFSRLYKSVMGSSPPDENEGNNVKELCVQMGNLTIVRKGDKDIISDGNTVLTCHSKGSPRRCGGQGDVLAGCMGTLAYWGHLAMSKSNRHTLLNEYGPAVCAAYGACLFTRDCSRKTFQKLHRSTLTTDILKESPGVAAELFG